MDIDKAIELVDAMDKLQWFRILAERNQFAEQLTKAESITEAMHLSVKASTLVNKALESECVKKDARIAQLEAEKIELQSMASDWQQQFHILESRLLPYGLTRYYDQEGKPAIRNKAKEGK